MTLRATKGIEESYHAGFLDSGCRVFTNLAVHILKFKLHDSFPIGFLIITVGLIALIHFFFQLLWKKNDFTWYPTG